MESLQRILKDKGVQFDSGLSNDEIIQIETKFNIKFPPDLTRFLQLGLPISDSFVNWRQGLISKDTEAKIDHDLIGHWKECYLTCKAMTFG